MKAQPYKLIPDVGYRPCEISEATHVRLNMPGTPHNYRMLPVQLKGKREGTGNWSWNGDTEKPTLKPSILTKGGGRVCHSYVNDGMVKYLHDCTHDNAGKTLPLLDVD